jgi:hypothetical protein
MKNNKVIWIDKENKNRTMSDISEEVWVDLYRHMYKDRIRGEQFW